MVPKRLESSEVPYTTRWLSYPDIADKLSSAGVPPTRTEKPFYTVPSIIDQSSAKSPVHLADSLVIVNYLEKTYPSRTIFPCGSRDIQLSYNEAIHKHVYTPMIPMAVPNTVRILDGRDLEFYRATRKDFLGVALEDMFPVHKQASLWRDLQKGLDEISALVDRAQGQRKCASRWLFSPNECPSYADFVLGSMFIWFKMAGPEGGWDRVSRWHGGRWGRLLRELQPYSQVR
ncbi:uncharacterized protein FIBRA_06269 [Fibroporia radiculosa]|uniref:Glutathione S-transferase UstS-like C-terminal domain-containing protein n=1 Tax=Fibroporia radiculosa TaxID=599839 RepID=J4H3Z6_9APHY|nr:uncharacterized protein FIBRA_06269 [Fibroporia radiculosa]CCM04109.1 predicted protein [Fibroporia radiculosa]